MTIADSIRVAIEALIANKLRACLTMLGIVIGISAVIALIAVGQGSQKAVADRIAGLGANLIFIEPGSSSSGGLGGGVGSAQTLSQEDADGIPGTVPGVVSAVSELRVPSQVSANGANTFARINGVSPDYANVLNFKFTEGEFFTSVDADQSKTVAVLGSSVAKQLFGDSDPIGQKIRIGLGRNSFISLDVVGLLSPTGGSSANSQDNYIYVPITLANRRIQAARGSRNSTLVSQITVQVTDKNQIGAVKTALNQYMLQRHNGQTDFLIESQDDIAATANAVNQTMTVLLGAIAGISLIVGGIGIMNIMLVSVTERTREIGIRKAVGARKSDIMMQFLTEAVTVTAIGGLIGIATGIGAAQFLNGKDIAGLGDNIQTVISWPSVIAAFVVSAVIGIFFGLYPAQRAASLRPIEALRYE